METESMEIHSKKFSEARVVFAKSILGEIRAYPVVFFASIDFHVFSILGLFK